jgi:hypothetical protein
MIIVVVLITIIVFNNIVVAILAISKEQRRFLVSAAARAATALLRIVQIDIHGNHRSIRMFLELYVAAAVTVILTGISNRKGVRRIIVVAAPNVVGK